MLSAAVAVLTATTWAAFEIGPSIDPRQELPDDVALLTATTWDRFEAAFPAQASCLTDVELEQPTEPEQNDCVNGKHG